MFSPERHRGCAVLRPMLRRLPGCVALARAAECPPSRGCRSWSCLKCGKNCMKHLFCDKCGHLQPPANVNLFQYIGLPEKFAITKSQLRSHLVPLQSKLHPDRFVTGTEKEKANSEAHSRLLSAAKTILEHPVRRARYLLRLARASGPIPLEEAESSHSRQPLKELLLEMFEYNERATEVESASEMQALEEELKQLAEEVSTEIDAAFEAGNLEEAEESTNRLAYVISIQERIAERKRGH